MQLKTKDGGSGLHSAGGRVARTCQELKEALPASGQQLNSVWGPSSIRKCSEYCDFSVLF